MAAEQISSMGRAAAKALEVATALIKWALNPSGGRSPLCVYAKHMVETSHLEMVCLLAERPGLPPP